MDVNWWALFACSFFTVALGCLLGGWMTLCARCRQ